MKSKIGNLLITAGIVCSLVGGALPVSAENRVAAERQARRVARGYYCGQLTGNRAGTFYFRIGGKVRGFDLSFGLERGGNAKIIGFDAGWMKIGDEFLITYLPTEDDIGIIRIIKATGRKGKNIAPCPPQLD